MAIGLLSFHWLDSAALMGWVISKFMATESCNNLDGNNDNDGNTRTVTNNRAV